MVLTQNIHESKREFSQIEHESTITSVEIQELKKDLMLIESDYERKNQEVNNKNEFTRELLENHVNDIDNIRKEICCSKDQISTIQAKFIETRSEISSLKPKLSLEKKEVAVMQRALAEFIEKGLQNLSEHKNIVT